MEMEKGDAFGSVTVEGKTGAGLPYAPQDWPNPGDVWTWKLGRRITGDGFYKDRIIFLPRRLQQKGKRKYFNSKNSIITYLQSEFPEADVDAFFQSFTWKVPASSNASGGKARITPHPKKVQPRSKSGKNGEAKSARRSWRLIMSKASSKKRIRFCPEEVKDVIDLSFLSNGTGSCESTADDSTSATNSKNIQASSSQNTGSQSSKDAHCISSKEITSESIPNDSDMLISSADNSLSRSLPKSTDAGPVNDQHATSQEKIQNTGSQSPKDAHCISSKEIPSESIPDDSNILISSADKSLSQSLPKSTDTGPVNNQHATSQEKMFEARKKLLSLLDTDNPVLSSSVKLPEIMHTTPNIDANPHGKLKLIDEVLLAWNKFQEKIKILEVAEKNSEDLETNIAWATTLVDEYNEAKGYEYVLHKELDSISLNMEKIDEQISALQSRRYELASAADVKKKEVDMLILKQERAAQRVSNAVHVVEMGKKRRQTWELEKEKSGDKKAKILVESVPLRDFFF